MNMWFLKEFNNISTTMVVFASLQDFMSLQVFGASQSLPEKRNPCIRAGTCQPICIHCASQNPGSSCYFYSVLKILDTNLCKKILSLKLPLNMKGWNAVIETNLTGTYLVSREVFNRHFKVKISIFSIFIIQLVFLGIEEKVH